jgi:hypothetical protein
MVVRLTGWWLGDKEEEALSLLKKKGEEEARLEEYSINYQGKGKTETASCTCSLRASTWNATRAAQSSDVSPTLLFSAVLKGHWVSGLGSTSFSTPREMWHSEKHRTNGYCTVALLSTGRW